MIIRRSMIALFIIGNLWICYNEIQYGEHRYFSEWAVAAKEMPKEDKVEHEMAVALLQRLNAELHKVHNSYLVPWLLLVVGGSGLIFVKEKKA